MYRSISQQSMIIVSFVEESDNNKSNGIMTASVWTVRTTVSSLAIFPHLIPLVLQIFLWIIYTDYCFSARYIKVDFDYYSWTEKLGKELLQILNLSRLFQKYNCILTINYRNRSFLRLNLHNSIFLIRMNQLSFRNVDSMSKSKIKCNTSKMSRGIRCRWIQKYIVVHNVIYYLDYVAKLINC